jgi:hypothetical protein
MNSTTLLVEHNPTQICIQASNIPSDNDCIKITNRRILDFYRSNTHISFETVNLHLLEILHNCGSTNGQIQKDQLETAIFRPEEKRRIDELNAFWSKLADAVHKQIQHISSAYIVAKAEYVQEFRYTLHDSNAHQIIQDNNARFIERIKQAVAGLRVSSIAEKTQAMIRQFQKILIANSDAIFAKDHSSMQKKEYVDNFESNAAHMMQAITQLLSDCLSEKERQFETQIAALKRRDVRSTHESEDANSASYYKLVYECNDILHQLLVHSDNDRTFDRVISTTFPTASITNELSGSENGPDKYIVQRDDKPTIEIESHAVKDRNIGLGEIKSFLKERTSHGILVSQYTGIAAKPNYHIEIQHNFITVYLHQLENSGEKLQIAVDMIDALSAKMGDFFMAGENKYSIPREVLDDINREYQQFIVQKETILTMVKDQHKRLMGQLDDIRFSSLDKYLATRYSSCKKQGYTCDLCNVFNVGTLKGLAAHKRGCARKLGATISSADNEPGLFKKVVAVL